MTLKIQISPDMDVQEVIRKYRELAFAEMRGESKPRERIQQYDTTSFLTPARPFFQSRSPDESKYILNFRLIRYAKLEKVVGVGAANALWYEAGRDLGRLAVSRGMVKSLDDLLKFVVDQRIGLVDVVTESNNKSRVHVYECISCSGIPNIGRPVCFFEGGLIAGVMEALMGRRVRVVETHCWGMGYSFCGFDILIE